MRIAIIGAGALGSYLGYKLDAGGHEIELIDSSARADQIRKSGISLKDVITGQFVRVDLSVQPEPQGEYDVVIVAVRTQQMQRALELAGSAAGGESDSETGDPAEILLIGSYVTGMSDWAEEWGEQSVLFAFPGMAAVLEKKSNDSVVKFCERGEDDAEAWGITLGKLRGPAAEQQSRVDRAMSDAGIPVHHAESMEAVFLSQALVRLPMLGALQYAGGTLKRLSARGDLLKLMLKASREGLAAVKRSGLKPVPDSLEMYRWVPIFVSANMIKHRLDTLQSQIGIEEFSKRSGDELRLLAGQFLEFAVASGAEFEHLEYVLSGFEEE